MGEVMIYSMTIQLPNVAGGVKLEADYETEGDGSGPSYSPMYGADGGDPLVILVEEVRYIEFDAVIMLSDDELEHVAEYICENHEFDDDRSDDWDDWR